MVRSRVVLLPSNRGIFSLCELTMSLSSHQITVSFEESSRSDTYPDELELFFKHIEISELSCELKFSSDLLYNSALNAIFYKEIDKLLVILLLNFY